MQVHRILPQVKNTIVSIGSFDGVHIGHQHLIHEVIKKAREKQGEDYLITFEPHPRLVIPSSTDFKLLTTIDEKIEKMEQMGVSNLVILPFSRELSQLSAEDFILNYILKPLEPQVVVLGYDHRFGKDRKGSQETFEILREKRNLDFEIVRIDEYQLKSQHISSTAIRQFISTNQIESANTILGSSYTLKGRVVRGQQLGRTIGYPTANMALIDAHKLIPSHGVYATRTFIDGQSYRSATSIGRNPTVSDTMTTKIETYILDFSEDIYDQDITLSFETYIREEKKLNSLEALQQEIHQDILKIRTYFSESGS